MKITTLEPAQADDPGLALPVTLPEPEPVQTETPAQAEERQAAETAAIAGTRALVAELQARLEAVESELTQHRQAAEQPFTGEPAALVAHLEAVERHRTEAERLTGETESLRRQCAVAVALLDRLEQEAADAESARTQAKGRALLADALERYSQTMTALADVVLDMGAAAMLANMQSSFIAATRSLCLPDLPGLGHSAPALAGFIKRREGQTVSAADPAFQQRMNELMR